ncbi:hypothetical protein ACNKHT_03410 [Shigella flexneri]
MLEGTVGRIPFTAGSSKQAKRPDVVKLRYSDIKKKQLGASVPWSAVLPQPVTYPYHPPQNDKGFNNDYHLYFRS